MTSRFYWLTWEPVLGAISVTVGDLVMSDGQRLEGRGVLPDLTSLPNGPELAARTDPVLAFAATFYGIVLSKEQAGRFYFLAPVPEVEDEQDKQTEE